MRKSLLVRGILHHLFLIFINTANWNQEKPTEERRAAWLLDKEGGQGFGEKGTMPQLLSSYRK